MRTVSPRVFFVFFFLKKNYNGDCYCYFREKIPWVLPGDLKNANNKKCYARTAIMNLTGICLPFKIS